MPWGCLRLWYSLHFARGAKDIEQTRTLGAERLSERTSASNPGQGRPRRRTQAVRRADSDGRKANLGFAHGFLDHVGIGESLALCAEFLIGAPWDG